MKTRFAKALALGIILTASILQPLALMDQTAAATVAPVDADAPDAGHDVAPESRVLRASAERVLLGGHVALHGAPGGQLLVEGPEGGRILALDANGEAVVFAERAGAYRATDVETGRSVAWTVLSSPDDPGALVTAPTALVLPDGSSFVSLRMPIDLANGMRMAPVLVTSLGAQLPLSATHGAAGATFQALVPAEAGTPLRVLGLPGAAADARIEILSALPAAPDVGVDVNVDALAARLGLPAPAAAAAAEPGAQTPLDAVLEQIQASWPAQLPARLGVDGEPVELPPGARVIQMGKTSLWATSLPYARTFAPSMFNLDAIREIHAEGLAAEGTIPVILQVEPLALPALPIDETDDAVDGLLGVASTATTTLADAPLDAPLALELPADALARVARHLGALGLDARALPIADGVATVVPMRALPVLALIPGVRAVHLDAPVRAQLDDSVEPVLGQSRANFSTAFAGANGTGMRIAILDTGIDIGHPALNDLDDIASTSDAKVTLWHDFAGSCSTPCDPQGHGTHVAGIAAGTAAGSAYEGVAPGATLLGARVLNGDGYGLTSWIVGGIDWSVDPDGNPATADGADVISMSLGGFDFSAHPDMIQLAVETATANGVLVVAAAGNEGDFHLGTPAGTPEALTVGAYDHRWNTVAYFSSTGPSVAGIAKPELVAPGVRIMAPQAGTANYVAYSGTSMATPHVSGAAALFQQIVPSANASETKGTLTAAAQPLADYGVLAQGLGAINLTRAATSCILVTEGLATVHGAGDAVFHLRNRCESPVDLGATLVTDGIDATLDAPATLAAGATGALVVRVTNVTETLGAANVAFSGGSVELNALVVGMNPVRIAYDGPLAFVSGVLDDNGSLVHLAFLPAGDIVLPPLAPGNYTLVTLSFVGHGAMLGMTTARFAHNATETIRVDTRPLLLDSHHVGFRATAVPLASACTVEFADATELTLGGCTALRYDGLAANVSFTSLSLIGADEVIVEHGAASWPAAPIAEPLPTATMRVDADNGVGTRTRMAVVAVRVAGFPYMLHTSLLVPEDGLRVTAARVDAEVARFEIGVISPATGERFGPFRTNATGFQVPGHNLAGQLSDDDTEPLALLSFPFFGQNVTNLQLSSNGFITTQRYEDGCCAGEPVPAVDFLNGIIAGYWNDLNPSRGGSIVAAAGEMLGARGIITTFQDVPHFGGSGLDVTFQMALLGDGRIVLSIEDAPSSGSNHTVGIERPDGLEGVQILHGNDSISRRTFVLTPRNNTSAPLAGTCETGSVHYACEEIAFTWANVEIASATLPDGAAIGIGRGPVLPYLQISGGALVPAAVPTSSGPAGRGFVSGPDGGSFVSYYVGYRNTTPTSTSISFDGLPLGGGVRGWAHAFARAVDGSAPAFASIDGDLFGERPRSVEIIAWPGARPISMMSVSYTNGSGNITWTHTVAPVATNFGGATAYVATIDLPPFAGFSVDFDAYASDGAMVSLQVGRPYYALIDLEVTPSAEGDCRPCLVTVRNDGADDVSGSILSAGYSLGRATAEGYAAVSAVVPSGGTLTRTVWLEMPDASGPWLAAFGFQHGWSSLGPVDAIVAGTVPAAPTVATAPGLATIAADGECNIPLAVSRANHTAGLVAFGDCGELTLARPLFQDAVVQTIELGHWAYVDAFSRPLAVHVPEGGATAVGSLVLDAVDMDGRFPTDLPRLRGTVTGPGAEHALYACASAVGHDFGGGWASGCSRVIDGQVEIILTGDMRNDTDVDIWGTVFGPGALATFSMLNETALWSCCEPGYFPTGRYVLHDTDLDGSPGWATVNASLHATPPEGSRAFLIAANGYRIKDLVEAPVRGDSAEGLLLAEAIDGNDIYLFLESHGFQAFGHLGAAPALGSEPVVRSLLPPRFAPGTPLALVGRVGLDGEAGSYAFDLGVFGPRGELMLHETPSATGYVERPLTTSELDLLAGERAPAAWLSLLGKGTLCAPTTLGERCLVDATWRLGDAISGVPSIRGEIVGARFADEDANGAAETLAITANVRTNATGYASWCIVSNGSSIGCGYTDVLAGGAEITLHRALSLPAEFDPAQPIQLYVGQWAGLGAGGASVSDPFALPTIAAVEPSLVIDAVAVSPRDLDGDGTPDAVQASVDYTAHGSGVTELQATFGATHPLNASWAWYTSTRTMRDVTLGAGKVNLTAPIPADTSTPLNLHAYVSAGRTYPAGSSDLGGSAGNGTLATSERLVGFDVRVTPLDSGLAASATPTIGRVEVFANTSLAGVDVEVQCPWLTSTPNVVMRHGCADGDDGTLIPGEWWLDGGGKGSAWLRVCIDDSCSYGHRTFATTLPDARPYVNASSWTLAPADLDRDGDADAVDATTTYAAAGALPVRACIAPSSTTSSSVTCEPHHLADESGWSTGGPRLLLGRASGSVNVYGGVSVCGDVGCHGYAIVRMSGTSVYMGAASEPVTVAHERTTPLDLDGDGIADAAAIDLRVTLGAGWREANVWGSDLQLTSAEPSGVVTRLVFNGTQHDAYVCYDAEDDMAWWPAFDCEFVTVNVELEPLFDGPSVALVDADADGLAEAARLGVRGDVPRAMADFFVAGDVFFDDYRRYEYGHAPVTPGAPPALELPFSAHAGPTTARGWLYLAGCISYQGDDICAWIPLGDATASARGIEPGIVVELSFGAVDLDGDTLLDNLEARATWSSARGGAPEFACLMSACFDAASSPLGNATGLRARAPASDYVPYPYVRWAGLGLAWLNAAGTSSFVWREAATVVEPRLWERPGAIAYDGADFLDLDGSGAVDTLRINVTNAGRTWLSASSDVWSETAACGYSYSRAPRSADGPVELRLALDPFLACGTDVRVTLRGTVADEEVTFLPSMETKIVGHGYASRDLALPLPAGAEATLRATLPAVVVDDGWADATASVSAIAGYGVEHFVWSYDDNGYAVLRANVSESSATLRIEGPVLDQGYHGLSAYRDESGNVGESYVAQEQPITPASTASIVPTFAYDGGDVLLGAEVHASRPLSLNRSSGCGFLDRSDKGVSNCSFGGDDGANAPSFTPIRLDGGEIRALTGDGASTLWASLSTSLGLSTTNGTTVRAYAWSWSVPMLIDGSRLTMPAWADAHEPDATVALALPINGTASRNFHGYGDVDRFEATSVGVLVACADATDLRLVMTVRSSDHSGVRCAWTAVAPGDVATLRPADVWAFGPDATYTVRMLPTLALFEGVLRGTLGTNASEARFGALDGCMIGVDGCDRPIANASGFRISFVEESVHLRRAIHAPTSELVWRGEIVAPMGGALALEWSGISPNATDLQLSLWNGETFETGTSGTKALVLPEAGTYAFALHRLASGVVSSVDLVASDARLAGAAVEGEPVVAQVNISNAGTSDVQAATVDLLVNGTRVASRDIANLGAGDTTTVSIDWTPFVAGERELTLSVRDAAPLEPAANLSNNADTIRVFVVDHEVVLAAAGAVATGIAPGGTAEYSIHVTNAGNIGDNITFNATGAPANWTAQVTPERAFVPAGGATTVTLRVTGPAATSGVANVTLTATVDAQPSTRAAVSTLTSIVPTLMSVGSGAGSPGGTVDIPVRISDVERFGSTSFLVRFDPSVATVAEVLAGDVPSGSVVSNVNNTAGTVTIGVFTVATPGPTGDYTLATLRMRVVGGSGSTTALDLNVTRLVDDRGTNIQTRVLPGLLTAGLRGDANGDGLVDIVDAMFVAQFAVGNRDASQLNLDSADANGDGLVDIVDAMFIAQYSVGNRSEL